jgi:ABC-type polysaccharide/polyol phosphate transport system ATPase subunit
MPGVFFSRDTNFILTLSPHYFEKHILEVIVWKRYDIQSILSDVYLKCETNDIIGLLGRNGSENLLCSSSELKMLILSLCELTKLWKLKLVIYLMK